MTFISRRAFAAASIAAIACLLVLAGAPVADAASPRASAAGGPEIVFAGGGSDEVVCIAVAVPVGSACEPAGMRGACHLVEHLVFDGSERYTREELSRWADDAGAFLNAFTRKETTVYFLVVPTPLFEKGLEILSQMILHSTFPAAEIAKERSVILEEMRRERDDPAAARERVVEGSLYRGSPLGEPISGYANAIEAMTESDIRDFYRSRYASAPLRVILMGGVDRGRARALVEEYFGGPGRPAPAAPPCAAPPPRWENEIVEREGAGEDAGFDMLLRMPRVGEKDFPAAMLFPRLLEADDSPLATALAARGLPAPEVGLEIASAFSALRIHVKVPDSLAEACRAIPAIVEGLSGWEPGEERLASAKTAFLASETLDREMYHFYIMSHGEAIALHGDAYREAIADGAARVRPKDCRRLLANASRGAPRWNACLVSTRGAAAGDARDAAGEAAGHRHGPFIASTTAPGQGVWAGARREGSAAAAIHLLFAGRACLPGPASPGLVELLLTTLETSAAGRALADDFDRIGARVAFGDNPYVPQDDYLLNPAFAFIRLEAPAGSIAAAADELGRFLSTAAPTEADLDAARGALMGELGMRSGSPFYTMRGAMAKALFGEHPYAAPFLPPPPVMGKATIADLTALRGKLFARGNVIATIVSPLDDADARSILDALMSRFPPGEVSACPTASAPAAPDTIRRTIRKEGAYVAMGWYVPCPSTSETAAAIVAGETLARRMQLELREKRGLAYSIDCSVAPVPGGAVVTAYLATAAARLDEAREALGAEVRGLSERPPDDAEVSIARNRLVGKRSRSELSSANGAYALGFDLLLGGGAYRPLNALIAGADPSTVRALVASGLARDRASLVELAPEKK